MELKRNGSQPSAKGPTEYFTGTVRVDPLFTSTAPARTSAAVVTFEPGSRSNWHSHPWARSWWSPAAAVTCRAGANLSESSVLATSSFALPGRSIGTARRRVPR